MDHFRVSPQPYIVHAHGSRQSSVQLSSSDLYQTSDQTFDSSVIKGPITEKTYQKGGSAMVGHDRRSKKSKYIVSWGVSSADLC